jgi:hypothetical protein
MSQSTGLAVAASMGLQNLQHEPDRLAQEADRLNGELESLVMDNYRVFVENLTVSVHLRSEDKKLALGAEELGSEFGTLRNQCSQFRDRVSAFVSAHRYVSDGLYVSLYHRFYFVFADG